ncbi:MAG: hypothetical protein ABIU63_07540 [Chitinophagaceae bacterium]
MKYFFFSFLFALSALSSQAKIWRVNNNPGVVADFTNFADAVAAATAGDTIHLEPSVSNYGTNSITLAKRITVIGLGYFLDPSSTAEPANTGLQAATKDGRLDFFRIGAGADGSRFIGINIAGGAYFVGGANISFEKVYFSSGCYFENGTNDAYSFRKCFFNNGVSISMSGTAVVTNFVAENNIFYNGAFTSLAALSGSGNIFRNNTIIGGNAFAMSNTYIANNIFGTTSACVFTNSTIKNNLFQSNQVLPGTATANLVNVDMTTVYQGGTTGSLDSRAALKAGSPAIAGGLTVGAVTTPDCGAFGATDPYKLSGIPNTPSIYSLSVPTSIPSGSTSMSIGFSTRNNN